MLVVLENNGERPKAAHYSASFWQSYFRWPGIVRGIAALRALQTLRGDGPALSLRRFLSSLSGTIIVDSYQFWGQMMHFFMHMSIHISMRVSLHMSIHNRVGNHEKTCLCTWCTQERQTPCLYASLHTDLYTYIYTYLCTFPYTCLHVQILGACHQFGFCWIRSFGLTMAQ